MSEARARYLADARGLAKAGRTQEALRLFRLARDATNGSAENVKTGTGAADRLASEVGIARCLTKLGYFRAGARAFGSAATALEKGGDHAGAAGCHQGHGFALDKLGRYEEALAAYERAAEHFRSVGDLFRWARAAVDQARLLGVIGRSAEALQLLDLARPILDSEKKALPLAYCEANRATVLRSLHKPEEALEAAGRAEELFTAGDRPGRAAGCSLLRCLCLVDLGESAAAKELLRATRARYACLGDHSGVAQSDVTMGKILANGGDLVAAAGLVQQALGVLISNAPSSATAAGQSGVGDALSVGSLAEAYHTLGRCQEGLGDWGAAHSSYLQGCGITEDALDRAGREASLLASLETQLPDCFGPAARALLHKAADSTTQREPAFVLTERGRSASLRKEYALSVTREQSLPTGSAQRDVARRRLLLDRLAEIDWRSGADNPKRRRILSELDRLEARLFESVPESAGSVSGALPSLRDLQAAIRPDEGVVAYSECSDDLLCFLVTRRDLVCAAEVPGANIRARRIAGRLWRKIGACESHSGPMPGSPSWDDDLRALGEVLLGPLVGMGLMGEGRLPRLTFISSPGLNGIPFAALGLPDRSAYTPLVRVAEVGLMPQLAARYYASLRRVPDTGMAAIVNPDGTLALGREEAEMLGEMLPSASIHLGDRANPIPASEFAGLVGGSRAIHVSCHGRHEPDSPLGSALMFGPLAPGGQPTYLSARQLYSVPARFELAFVAACQSGQTQSGQGSPILGLLRGLLFLSRRVVAAQWTVSESSSMELARLFYSSPDWLADPVHALAEAQRAMIDPAHPASPRVPGQDFVHPYFWAGFFVAG